MINFVLFCEIITANLKMCFVKLKKRNFVFRMTCLVRYWGYDLLTQLFTDDSENCTAVPMLKTLGFMKIELDY